MKIWWIGATTIAVACTLAGSAAAAEEIEGATPRPLGAPNDAFEIDVNTGYTQGFGSLGGQPGGAVSDVARGGIGVEGKFHFQPHERIDPWLSLGAGYRLLWIAPESPGNNVLQHGFQLARGQVGLDVRVSPDVALGPVIGGDVNLFVARNPEGPAGDTVLPEKQVNALLFAGVQGRFDVDGTRVERTGTIQTGGRR